MNRFTLECCVDSYESATIAALAGANRLELCSNLIIGGTTPSLHLLRKIKNSLNIPVHVLIRPRFGDFLYSKEEFSLMCEDIKDFAQNGADGIVCGCLNRDGSLDTNYMNKIKELCKNRYFTLHRAFDVCKDPFATLKECEEIGVDAILTSGQGSSCTQGTQLISQLFYKKSSNIEILVGGGVNSETIQKILSIVPIKNFHMSGKKTVPSGMEHKNSKISMGIGDISEYTRIIADEKQIKDAYSVLHAFYK